MNDREWAAEFASQWRWLWAYRLPKGLAAPFHSTIFLAAFGAILAIFFLASLISVPALWGDFFRNILRGIWIKYLAEHGADQWVQFIESIPFWLSLILFLAMCVVAILARLWAEPRRKFFDGVEQVAKLKILRGGGSRLAFLNRINEALNPGLGRGPTGNILPDYFPLSEDSHLLSEAKNVRPYRKGILISAPAAAGKTRTALEVAYRLPAPLVIVWTRGYAMETRPHFPAWKDFTVILADDLAFNPAPGEGVLPAVLQDLIQVCPRGVILATARQERIPQDVRDLACIRLESVPQESLLPLAQRIALIESSPERQITAQEVLERYDGHPGSLVAGLAAMKDKFDALPADQRALLETAGLMWHIGLRKLSLDRIWDCHADLWGRQIDPVDQEALLGHLKQQGFCGLAGNGDQWIEIYESYLDRVIPLPIIHGDLNQSLWEGFQRRGDAEAFFEIGNTWAEEYSPAFQHNPRRGLQRAIQAYTAALEYCTPEGSPLDYATTQNNLGSAYSRLAGYEQPVENLGKAIECYTAALEYYTPEGSPLDRARACGNRAEALIRLDRLAEAEADCRGSEELAPNNPYSHGRWGQLQYARGNYSEAVERYRKAAMLAQATDPTEFNFDLALPLFCLAQPEEALSAIRARLVAHRRPSDLRAALPEFEKLNQAQPEILGLEEALALLRAALESPPY